jgi:hypothetical protein
MRASILGKNYVYKWLRDSDAVEGPRLDFTGHVGDITLFGSRDRVFNLPPSQLFDTVQVRFGDWRTAFNSKGIESVPFLMSKTTFCLSDSPQYSVHLVWEPIEVPLQAYSRDECQKATADGALSLVEANAVANFIAGLLPAEDQAGKYTIRRDDWVTFFRNIRDNYAEAVELQGHDFFNMHAPAVYMTVRSSECMHMMEEGEDDEDWSDDEAENNGNDDNEQFRDAEEPVQHRRLQALLPVTSAGLERVHLALSLILTDQDDPGRVPLFSREWVAEEFKSNEVVFMPLGFSPAFGGFSATTVPDCLVGMVKSLRQRCQQQNGNVDFLSFGSCEGLTIFGAPLADEATMRRCTVGGCFGGSDPRMSLEIEEATTADDALAVREEFIEETLEDDAPAVLRIAFNAMVDITQLLQANRRLDVVISNLIQGVEEEVEEVGGQGLGVFGFPKEVSRLVGRGEGFKRRR